MQKVVTLNKVANYSKRKLREGRSVGLVAGSYDICHLGHIRLFRLAKKYVDILIVGLDSDRTIKKDKG